MPNDCWNYMTFICEKNEKESKELELLFNREFEEKKIPERGLIIHYKGCNGIQLSVWSAWGADYEWLNELLKKYPNCWIKNQWYEEGGGSGLFVGGFLNGIKQKTIETSWDELPIEGLSLYLGGDKAINNRYRY